MPSFKQIKNNPKVHYLAKLPADMTEPACYEVELVKGWSFDPSTDNRIRFEDTLQQVKESLIEAVEFSGPYEN